MPESEQTIWKNRIVGHGSRAAKDFIINPLNWRTHPEFQRRTLNAVLTEIGWVTGVIENITTGHLIDGHARIEEAIAKTPEELVPFIQVELSEDEERKILAVIDPVGGLATTDDEKLRELSEILEFESGKEMSCLDLLDYFANQFPEADSIIWTGGEPAQQLTEKIVNFFKEHHFYQAIETSGLFAVPENLDWISVSPKVAEHVILKNFTKVNELRYVRHAGQSIPQPSIEAGHYYLSPHSDGFEINSENLKHCIDLCLKNPKWKLSIQQHKVWNLL